MSTRYLVLLTDDLRVYTYNNQRSRLGHTHLREQDTRNDFCKL